MSQNSKVRRSGVAYACLMSRYGGFMHDRREVRGGSTNKQRIYLDEARDNDEIEEDIEDMLINLIEDIKQ